MFQFSVIFYIFITIVHFSPLPNFDTEQSSECSLDFCPKGYYCRTVIDDEIGICVKYREVENLKGKIVQGGNIKEEICNVDISVCPEGFSCVSDSPDGIGVCVLKWIYHY